MDTPQSFSYAIQKILNSYRPYAFEWGERVLIFGGDGRLGQVTPPA